MLQEVNKQESEEHNKNLVRDLLQNSYYRQTNAVNTKGKTDLAIYAGLEDKITMSSMLMILVRKTWMLKQV